MKKTSLTLLLLAFTAWGAEPALVIKETTGEAAIAPGAANGEAAAFEEAKRLALRQAVEEAAGVLVQSDTLTLNSQLVSDRVYSKAQGYVKKFEILEKKADKKTVKVKIRAEVGTAELDKDLQAVKGIISRLANSRLLIVTQEVSIDAKGVSQASEILSTRLADAFRRDGWRLIDEKGTGKDGAMKLSVGVGAQNLDAKEIASKKDTDYILYGRVNLRFIAPKEGGYIPEVDSVTKAQNIYYADGDYDLALFEVRSGTNLSKVAGKMFYRAGKGGAGSSLISYEDAANKLCNVDAPRIVAELRNPVIEYLRDKDVNGNNMELIVNGLPDLDSVDDFSKSVQTMSNVKEVKSTSDFDNGRMVYNVTFSGTAMELGKALGRSKFKAKAIKVTTVKNNLLEVAIAK